MRTIERKIIDAINKRRACKLSTRDEIIYGETYNFMLVKLHNTIIARIDFDARTMTIGNGYYYTSTTKSRLNAILREYMPNYRITQKNFTWYFSGLDTEDIDFNMVNNHSYIFNF
jgi:hypothetical protein